MATSKVVLSNGPALSNAPDAAALCSGLADHSNVEALRSVIKRIAWPAYRFRNNHSVYSERVQAG